MRRQNDAKRVVYQLFIVLMLVFVLSISSIYLLNKTGTGLTPAVIFVSTPGVNATVQLFDSGDFDNSSGTPTAGPFALQTKTLLNGTDNVNFYSNFTNATSSSMVGVAGSQCDIEFESGIGSVDRGPFSMAANTELSLFEYNKSFPNNGTFMYNVTCSNTNAGVGPISASDEFRIFDPGCLNPHTTNQNSITSNTILCSGSYTINSGGDLSVFVINQNNITLNCNGANLSGTNTKEVVSITSRNGFVLENCFIANFSSGITTATASANDEILIYNNSFTNMSSRGIEAVFVRNVTIRSNNFTTSLQNAVYLDSVSNATVSYNNFCGSDQALFSNASNTTIVNNTLCVTQTDPLNGTSHNSINFTFTVPSLNLNRTCNFTLNGSIPAGSFVVQNSTNPGNITVNESIYAGQDFTWSVSCSDVNNNTGTSLTFNNSYTGCTVPTPLMSIPNASLISFCPGTFQINNTVIDTQMNVSDSVYTCNNTIFRGNQSTSFIILHPGNQNLTLQHCDIANYSFFVNGTTTTEPRPRNITIYNNTVLNISDTGIVARALGYNITGNTIISASTGILIFDGINTTVENNTITNMTSKGIVLINATAAHIISNNISGDTIGIAEQRGALSTINNITPQYSHFISGNTICENNNGGMLVNNTVFATTASMSLIANNSFCNATTGNVNSELIKVIWSLDVQVVNATNTGIPLANVNISDATGTYIFTNQPTKASGITGELNITEFIVYNNESIENKTPISFVAAKNNEKSNLTRQIINVSVASLNSGVIVNLSQDATSPNVTTVTPERGLTSRAINFIATVNDTAGIQSCSLFGGLSSSPSITSRGLMDYNKTSGQVNRTITFTGVGTYTLYANCTDNGGNIGYNETSVLIFSSASGAKNPASVKGSGSKKAGPVGEAAPEMEEEPVAEEEPAAEEQAAEAVEEKKEAGDKKKDDEEDIENIVEGDIIAVDYGIKITDVYANGELVYKDGEQINSIAIKDDDILTIVFTINNEEVSSIDEITIGIGNIPHGLYINKIIPKTTSLGAESSEKITIEVESKDIAESFLLKIYAESEEASAIIAINAILEEGRGAVYYTRQKIIEETKETVERTYKILFLLFIIPILLLLRTTTVADEKSLRRMLKDKSITKFWKIYVLHDTHTKYNMLPNVRPIKLEEQHIEKAKEFAAKHNISYELASLIVFARTRLIPRVFTMEEISPELRHHYPRIWFTSPMHNYKEEQLKRYIEIQQAKNFINNQIRKTLLDVGWKKEIIKKYLDPEQDIKEYVEIQQKKGHNKGIIRKQLLDAKWDEKIVDMHLPKEEVLKEYVIRQRLKGRSNQAIRNALLKAGWKKELVYTFLNPINDLKTYITAQLHLGVEPTILKEKLIKVGWKKEVIEEGIRKK